jgi:hypothetical protein
MRTRSRSPCLITILLSQNFPQGITARICHVADNRLFIDIRGVNCPSDEVVIGGQSSTFALKVSNSSVELKRFGSRIADRVKKVKRKLDAGSISECRVVLARERQKRLVG